MSFSKVCSSISGRVEKSTGAMLKGGLFGLVSLVLLSSCSQPPSHEAAAPSASKSASVGQEPRVDGLQPHLRMISQEQYRNSLANIFGNDVVPPFNFAPPTRTEGLVSVGGAYMGITDSQVEKYQRVASLVADAVISPQRRGFLIPCKPANEKASDKACASQFLGSAGMLLFRRPLPQAKLDEFVDIVDEENEDMEENLDDDDDKEEEDEA